MKTNVSAPAAPLDVGKRRRRGAPPGNRNAFKTGAHVKEVRALRRHVTFARRTMKLLIAHAKEAPRQDRDSRGVAEDAEK